ncbi:MAG: hypothetical protein AAFO82_10970, partial [Bacteroidota bacterium]
MLEIGKDKSTIRTFTKNEIELFLALSGFGVKEMIQKESYAFPTYLVIAEKNLADQSERSGGSVDAGYSAPFR